MAQNIKTFDGISVPFIGRESNSKSEIFSCFRPFVVRIYTGYPALSEWQKFVNLGIGYWEVRLVRTSDKRKELPTAYRFRSSSTRPAATWFRMELDHAPESTRHWRVWLLSFGATSPGDYHTPWSSAASNSPYYHGLLLAVSGLVSWNSIPLDQSCYKGDWPISVVDWIVIAVDVYFTRHD